jgi:putative endonuclease
VKRYYVYMLFCFDGTYYVGITNNVDRRLWEHEHGLDPHCYTFKRRPLKLAFVGEFQWVDEAIAFEKKLKGWSHRKKRAFADKAWASLKRYSRAKNDRSPLSP